MKFLSLFLVFVLYYSFQKNDLPPLTSYTSLTAKKPYRITWPKWQAMLENHKRKHPGVSDSTLRTHAVDIVLRSKIFTGYLFWGSDTTATCLFITIDSAKKPLDTVVLLGKKVTPWPTVYLRQFAEIDQHEMISTYDSIKQIGKRLNNISKQPAYVITVAKNEYLIYSSGKIKQITGNGRQYLPKDK